MSKPMEPASPSVAMPGRVNPVNQNLTSATKQHGIKDDVSLTHVGLAIGVFAVMIGLFGYGFYVQQARVSEKEAALRVTEVSNSPKLEAPAPISPAALSDGSAEAATVPHPMTVSTIKEETIASPIPAQIESVHADIYFDFGKTRLRADAVTTLQQQATTLKQDGHWAVLIQGYTDRHGSIEYNRSLALRRGESAKQFLVELGVPAESIKVVSVGQDAALCDDHTITCKRLNRRVHLELVKLEAPVVSLAPPTPAPTVTAQQQAMPSPLDSVESAENQETDTVERTAVSPTEESLDTTVTSPESH